LICPRSAGDNVPTPENDQFLTKNTVLSPLQGAFLQGGTGLAAIAPCSNSWLDHSKLDPPIAFSQQCCGSKAPAENEISEDIQFISDAVTIVNFVMFIVGKQ